MVGILPGDMDIQLAQNGVINMTYVVSEYTNLPTGAESTLDRADTTSQGVERGRNGEREGWREEGMDGEREGEMERKRDGERKGWREEGMERRRDGETEGWMERARKR